MERDYLPQKSENHHTHFNSHAHVERDTSSSMFISIGHNFNSHAHVERDVSGNLVFLMLKISTHTLTWSVTGERVNKYQEPHISTHTLTWSVTY